TCSVTTRIEHTHTPTHLPIHVLIIKFRLLKLPLIRQACVPKMAPPRVTTKKKDDSKDNSVSYEGDFFQFSPLFISIIIIFLMIFYWFVCYNIDVVPLHSMGPFGTFVSYLANNHLKLLRLGRMMFSRVTSFQWMFQTALVGFPSLGLLLRHRKQREIASKKFLLVLEKLKERVM
ncbi:hypothetical protein pdam_00013040, partial [Pocillopora damicornis]